VPSSLAAVEFSCIFKKNCLIFLHLHVRAAGVDKALLQQFPEIHFWGSDPQ